MKQDLTAVIRWPFLFLFASTTYLIASSLLLWHAQFLHSIQYQLVRFLHTIQWPLARNPWWLLSTSLTLNTGLPSQYLNLFVTSWLNSLVFDFNVLRTSLFGERQVSLAIELVHSESKPKFGAEMWLWGRFGRFIFSIFVLIMNSAKLLSN